MLFKANNSTNTIHHFSNTQKEERLMRLNAARFIKRTDESHLRHSCHIFILNGVDAYKYVSYTRIWRTSYPPSEFQPV